MLFDDVSGFRVLSLVLFNIDMKFLGEVSRRYALQCHQDVDFMFPLALKAAEKTLTWCLEG